MDPRDISLAFFLSRATPLCRWDKMGILDREIAIYRELALRLGGVSIVTSGGAEELNYQERLGDVRILHNRWGLSPNTYSLLAPILHWSALRRATVYKTNQPDGSWTGVLASMMHRRPAIVRAGYLWAEFHRQEGGGGVKAALIDRLQAFSFRKADAIVLTTEAMKEQVVGSYGVSPTKVKVIPNNVDTGRFRPMPDVQPVPGQVCYVGRLHPRKNLNKLIRAIARIHQASLVLIGEGEQRGELERLVGDCGAPVRFAGVLPQQRIPLEINRSDVFILPSSFEGHPKALIEAMACGLAVVGTDVEGINNVVTHEQTGLLCALSVDGIEEALRRLLGNRPLRARLGQAARAYVQQAFSLQKMVEDEINLLQQVQGAL